MGIVQSIQNSIYSFVTRNQIMFYLLPIVAPFAKMITKNTMRSNDKITDKKGKSYPVVNIDGRYFPAFGVDKIKSIPDITIRKTDVILCGYPKTGAHWVHEILSMLVRGNPELSKYGKGMGSFIDMMPNILIDSLADPRVLNTHVLYDELPRGIKELKNKIILTVRNPKDTVVSYYHHIKDLEVYGYTGEFDDFFDLFVEPRIEYGSYFDYYLKWDELLKNPERHPILLVKYEDNKADPIGCVKRIAKFLELEITDKFAAEVVENTSLNKMKAKRAGQMGSELLRKGVVGGWSNMLSEDQSKIIDREWNDKMSGLTHQPVY